MDLIKYDMTDIWAVDGDVVAPDGAKIRAGWGVEVVPRQWWNWFENRQDNNIAYLLQKGIPEWDATTEYLTNKSYVQRNNIVYKCTLTNTGLDPSTTPANWVKAFPESSAYLELVRPLAVSNNSMAYIDGSGVAQNTPVTTYGRSLINTADAAAARTLTNTQTAHANLTALSGVVGVTNGLPYFNSPTSMGTATLTAYGRSLISALDAGSARTVLDVLSETQVDSAIATRQPLDATLTSLAGLSATSNTLPYFSGVDVASLTAFTAFGRTLVGSADVAGARTNLGLGTMATQNASAVAITGGTITGSYGLNAATATALATPRTINGVSFDGTASITVADNTKLPLAGGTMTGVLSITNQGNGLRMYGPATGVNNTSFASFYDSASTRQGWVGKGDTASQDVYLSSDFGNVKILPSGGSAILYYTTLPKLQTTATGVTVTGSLVADNLIPTTSTTDSTVGRLLKVGDFGLGAALVSVATDLNTYLTAGSYIIPASGVTNLPHDWSQGRAVLTVTGGTAYAQQVITRNGYSASRWWNGTTWEPWYWEYSEKTAVGVVSQSAGVPTGAIIEEGSNANGSYTKWADGTMICHHLLTGSLAIGTAHLGGFRSTGLVWTYPVAFAAAPQCSATVRSLTAFSVIEGNPPTTISADFGFTAITSTASGTRSADVMAIGRWY